MELTFAIDKDQGIRIKGELKSVSLVKSMQGRPLLTLTFHIDLFEYINVDKSELTRFFDLPWPTGGTVRLFGADAMDFAWEIMSQDFAQVTISFAVKGWHKTYEEACAAEMEEKMRNK